MEEMQLVDGQLDSQLNIKYIEDEKPIDENCEKIVNFLSNSISTDEYLFPKSCYTCKTRYFECHHYYDLVLLFISFYFNFIYFFCFCY